MSCFDGLMEEYKYISIDRFDGPNLSSSAFFLSHCHTDHMVGLASSKFLQTLESGKDIKLYVSDVTRGLLLADPRYVKLEKYIASLPLESSTIIQLHVEADQLCSVAVTLISAGHCPGSVMFLFEGEEGNVLYTGDFRFSKGTAKRIRSLHTFDKKKKDIKSIYVDTTFCTPNAVYIPSREESVSSLMTLIREWLAKDENNAIKLLLSAKYGYEFIFHELNKDMNCKIYCRRRNLYQCLKQTYGILTENPNSVRIFACMKMDKLDLVGEHLNFLSINLSTLYFTDQGLPEQICERISDNSYRYCFSFHSSYSEVCDFVKYVNPNNVYANVIPYSTASLEQAARELTLKCGLKLSANSTLKRSKYVHLQPGKVTNESGICKQGSVKRARSFDLSDDDNTQDGWDKLLSITGNKTAKIVKDVACTELMKNRTEIIPDALLRPNPSYNNNLLSSCNNSSFDIPCSPNCKSPTRQEIDALHVKLALGDDLSWNS